LNIHYIHDFQVSLWGFVAFKTLFRCLYIAAFDTPNFFSRSEISFFIGYKF
jgi:hypothetical protein